MLLHCFRSIDIKAALGTSNLLEVPANNETIKISFKTIGLAKDIFPEEDLGDRIKMLYIDCWTENSRSRACDIKLELFNIGVPSYLVDTDSNKVITIFMPKNKVAAEDSVAA